MLYDGLCVDAENPAFTGFLHVVPSLALHTSLILYGADVYSSDSSGSGDFLFFTLTSVGIIVDIWFLIDSACQEIIKRNIAAGDSVFVPDNMPR